MNLRRSTAANPTADHRLLPKLVLAGIAAAALSIGGPSAVSASTGDTQPNGEATEHTDTGHTIETTAANLAVDGSADPTSPEAETFCTAELAAEAAVTLEDEAAIGAAVETLSSAAEPVGLTDTIGALLANVAEGGPEFNEAYAAVIDYMKANCGYAELNVSASEYHFDMLPSELPAGPTIISLDNVGEQVHEIWVGRINDHVTLAAEELAELPEDELHGMVTFAGTAFTFPGATGYGAVDLTPGRYVAMCFLPEGATPDVLMQLEQVGADGPGGTLPEGIEVGPPHYTLGMVHEFTVT